MLFRNSPPLTAHPWRQRPWRPAAPALLLVALLGSAGVAQAQQGPTRQLSINQAPNRLLIPYPDASGASLTQVPGNPQALPIQPPGPGGMRQQLKQLSPSQQQQLFTQQRDLQARFMRDRIQLLQGSERCLKATTNLDQMHNCKRQERQANMDLRRRHGQDMTAMLRRFGITLPDRPPKGGRWGQGPGGPGQPEGPGGEGPGPGPRGGLF